MNKDARREERGLTKEKYSISWKCADGQSFSAEARGVDVSKTGVAVECAYDIEPGSIAYVQARDSSLAGDFLVRHCTRRGANFFIGFELPKKEVKPVETPAETAPEVACADDFYDVLQINREADQETVHRVF